MWCTGSPASLELTSQAVQPVGHCWQLVPTWKYPPEQGGDMHKPFCRSSPGLQERQKVEVPWQVLQDPAQGTHMFEPSR